MRLIYNRLFGARTYDHGKNNGTKYTPSSRTKLPECILTQPRDGDVAKARFNRKLSLNIAQPLAV